MALFVLSLCPFDISVGVGAFVIELSQISSFFSFYLHVIARGFHRTFATGAACQQRTLIPPDTWSCSTLGLASILMLRPISPELVLFLDFWVSNIPRYFCFCLMTKINVPESSLYLHSVQSFYPNNIAELLWYGKILFILLLYLTWGVVQCEYGSTGVQ